jgi:hypothetical protein
MAHGRKEIVHGMKCSLRNIFRCWEHLNVNKTKQSNLLHRYRQGLKIPFDAIPIYI